MHNLKQKLTALEYAVVFLIEREERKIMARYPQGAGMTPDTIRLVLSDADLQDLARLGDCREEIKLHMSEKPERAAGPIVEEQPPSGSLVNPEVTKLAFEAVFPEAKQQPNCS
jgi:hypothetical protein